MSDQTDPDQPPLFHDPVHHRIVSAALTLAARDGWRGVTLNQIAVAAGIGLGTLYRMFPAKSAILAGLIREVDMTVLAVPTDEEEPPRDRLFEVLMRRFDALARYRDGLRRIAREAPRDLFSVIALGPPLTRSMGWMLEAAGIDGGGIGGLLRRHALAALYVSVFRVWLDDETDDCAVTLAALDARLRQADSLYSCLRRGIRRKPPAGPTAGPKVD
ncbi:MAG: helix-turn-helix domain containing protein [Azospirillaceae bacterium]|nr:helix-turn-helix domain containing protein [Azospirillaceae bacterium]